MEKGQFKEFNTLEQSERKWGWKKKIGYWFGCWKVVHKGWERVPFTQKEGEEVKCLLMDEPVSAVKGGNCLRNPILLGIPKISQIQQKSHLWYLGEWASFYPSLPRLFLNRSLIDCPINHKLTAQTASVPERRLALLLNDGWSQIQQSQQQTTCWLLKQARSGNIAGFYYSVKSGNQETGGVWFDLHSSRWSLLWSFENRSSITSNNWITPNQ